MLNHIFTVAFQAIVVSVILSNAILAQQFEKYDAPQRMYVLSSTAETMSSPDEHGYATGTLKRNDVVEAYGRIGDEWVAIRPPAGQFDWVVSQYAHLLPGGHLAEIIETPTPSWIHSQSRELGQLKWQLQLQPTQQITVLAKHVQKLEDGKTRAWYKIAPPPGEFRWIAATQLSEQPPKIRMAKQSDFNNQPLDDSEVESEKVQQASVIVNVESEPIELAPGETIVQHEDTPLWDLSNEGMILEETFDQEGNFAVDDVTGEIIPTVDGGDCPDCSDGTCSECEPDFGAPLHRLRPISRLLSCFGIAIVEAERPVDFACGGCGLATCQSCMAGGRMLPRAATIGSLPSRLDQLPRPTRQFGTSDVEDSILIDRLGDARRQVRESLDTASTNFTDRTKSLLVDTPKVSLGTPIRDALSSQMPMSASRNSNANTETWQGLPSNGIESHDVQLDVESPTSQEDWTRRPQTGTTNGTKGGTLLQTSSPSTRDQGFQERSVGNNDDLNFTDQKLRSAAAKLTTIVSMPTEQWQLGQLRSEVEAIVESGNDPLVRGEARLLLERIDHFEDFRARWMRANSNRIVSAEQESLNSTARIPVQTASFQSSVEPTGAKSVAIANMAAAQEIIRASDASGWLVAVHSDRPDYPKFALTDDAGRLVAYVESSPALNLRGYLQQPVAIHGQRGMHALLNARSIYAERIIRISDAK